MNHLLVHSLKRIAHILKPTQVIAVRYCQHIRKLACDFGTFLKTSRGDFFKKIPWKSERST